MRTVSIKLSARELCSHISVNRFLYIIREDDSVQDRFWPRLLKDKSINYGQKVGVKIDQENLDYLRELKKFIRNKYGIFVSYSMLICALVKVHNNRKERILMSQNVKGFKAMSRDFVSRLKGIAKEVKKVLPDILLLQEFRAGDENCFLNAFMKELGDYYVPVFPISYKESEDFNNYICITLLGKNINHIQSKRLSNESYYKLRYNMIEVDDYVMINAWVPQIFSAQSDRVNMAEKMWNCIINVAQYYHNKKQKFCLAGDLNAYLGGPFEEQIKSLNTYMWDTKIIDDLTRPTGIQNVLDYFYVNRFAELTDKIRTKVLEPSIKQMELSDHDALITVINEMDYPFSPIASL